LAPFGIDLMGLRKRGQVANRPRNYVAVAVQISVALTGCARTLAMSRATEGFSASTAIVPGSGAAILGSSLERSEGTGTGWDRPSPALRLQLFAWSIRTLNLGGRR
jgi:hypothetical protein